MIITFLDRVCISVAGPRMQEALQISPIAWGWVTGIFRISYSLFEIPSGALGDRIGPRRVLTRIVLWWSGFTSITGLVTGYVPLLLVRFLFGMGEAGALPNAGVAVARWFPLHEQGRAFGILLMAGQFGSALAPLLVVPIQIRYGWRASFFAFGSLGVAWSVVWYRWFRDSPAENPRVSPEDLEETRSIIPKAPHGLPWAIALRSGNLWAVMGLAFCYLYTLYFFQSWLPTYLVKGRGFGETDLLLTSAPFLAGALGNLGGGLASHALIRRVGLKLGRRTLGVLGLGIAAACMLATLFTHSALASMILLSLAFAGITFQQPTVFAVCLDIGREYSGAVVGAMNTAASAGAFVGSVAFGYLVDRSGGYDAPFIPMVALLVVGGLLWLKVDPTRALINRPEATGGIAGSATAIPA
jgi:MFS transporter, ACS family, glucarate transporter